MAEAHSDASKHMKAYIGVFIALAVFTVLTVTASRVHVSTPMHIGMALAIAAFKASLVAAIFMHLKWEKCTWIWFTLALCAVFFVFLMCLPTLIASDMPVHTKYGTWG
ncbi:MAG: cytochrome C oxidase subunit IV family protein [Planctomycetes bacterium]|nr:cytochrome C oxidase subunit IV family protein [Planctomycetota bacterium]